MNEINSMYKVLREQFVIIKNKEVRDSYMIKNK